MKKINKNISGFSLIETVIGSALFMVFAVGFYLSFSSVMKIVDQTKLNSAITKATESEMEKIRNMSYQYIGVIGENATGTLSKTKTLTVQGHDIEVTTFVKSVDDPVDNLYPTDINPDDYKYVQIDAKCPTCTGGAGSPIVLATQIAPKIISELNPNKGAILVKVFDANGAPINGVTVNISNSSVSPAVNITNITNQSGVLQISNLATSTNYMVTVSKTGYTSDQTRVSSADNPNPVTPPVIVIEDVVSPISFTLDKSGQLTFIVQTEKCVDISDMPISLSSWRLVGETPDIPKYSITNTLNRVFNNMEWGTYNFSESSNSWIVSGVNASSQIILQPDEDKQVRVSAIASNSNAFVVRVTDAVTKQLINDATVILSNGNNGFSRTLITGQRSWTETDWSNNNFATTTSNITADTSISLTKVANKYPTSEEYLISKTFDVGTSTGKFNTISWTPTSQPSGTTIKFQVAGNNDDATWNFVGPDNTNSTYFMTSGANTVNVLSNYRYMRYKVFLSTTNINNTPSLNEITFNYNSSCIVDGSVFFTDLGTGDDYSVNIQKSGYTTYTDNHIDVKSNWAEYNAMLK